MLDALVQRVDHVISLNGYTHQGERKCDYIQGVWGAGDRRYKCECDFSSDVAVTTRLGEPPLLFKVTPPPLSSSLCSLLPTATN